MSLPARLGRRLRGLVVAAHRRQVSRQQGYALLVVTVTIAVLGAVVAEFGYNARVDLEGAANARDQLKAEYLARSGVSLSRLLIKVQQNVLDRINNQFKMDVQIGEFAPYLMKAFGGAEGGSDLAALLGIEGATIKGLGVGKGGGFDVVMEPEDGKININCGGGLNAGGGGAIPGMGPQGVLLPGGGAQAQLPTITNPKQALYALLAAMVYPPRYNRLFETADPDGQFTTREELARAIIDWSDIDELRYEPLLQTGNNEDDRYEQLRDPYKPRHNFYDTVEEVQLVRGVTDDVWGSFGEMFTVYGRCKINLNAVRAEHWPILAAVLRAAARDRNNPVLADDTMVAALAQQLKSTAAMMGGFQNLGQLADWARTGGAPPQQPGAPGQPPPGGSAPGQPPGGANPLNPMNPLNPLGGGAGPTPIPNLGPVDLNQQSLQLLVTTGPREVYRIDSTGTIERGAKKVEVHLRAVFDTKKINQNTTSADAADRVGTWVYWRMD